MARFADMLQGWRWQLPPAFRGHDPGPVADDLRGRVRAATVVAADNVCEYFYAGTPQEDWDYVRDFPCCAPPFPSFFIEMARPSRILSGDTVLDAAARLPLRWGWLFEARDRGQARAALLGQDLAVLARVLGDFLETKARTGALDVRALGAAMQDLDPVTAVRALGVAECAGAEAPGVVAAARASPRGAADLVAWITDRSPAWTVLATLVGSSHHGWVAGPLLGAVLEVEDSGQLRRPPRLLLVGPAADAAAASESEGRGPLLMPALLALSFMHCKNVRLEQQTPPPQRPRALRDNGGRPFVHYYTLDIGPMRAVLRTEGRSGEVGLPRALGFCRGHFADYTERGLFGKYFGRYWVPLHARGDARRGVVVKDYDVSPR